MSINILIKLIITNHLVDALDGLGYVEPYVGHTVGRHSQDCGQEQSLRDVSSASLSQHVDTEQTSLELLLGHEYHDLGLLPFCEDSSGL